MSNSNPAAFARSSVLSIALVAFVVAGCSVPTEGAKSSPSGSNGGTAPGQSATPPASATSEGGGIAAACADGGAATVVDGWSRAIHEDSLALENDGTKVELYYAFELTDALRAGGDVPPNVWDALLGSRYRVKSRATGSGVVPIATGDAVDIASGNDVFIAVAPTVSNGVARPVVVIAPSRAAFESSFPTADAVTAMHRYNALPLSCAGLDGAWTSSFSSAAATYGATGAFTGITVSSLSVELSFTDGTFKLHTKAFANGASEVVDDDGKYVSEDYGVTLEGKRGPTAYDAAFVAVKGGLALFLENRALSGDRQVLYRAR